MAEEEEEKKSSKMMIIIIAVVVLLAGGGGAYYFMFMGDDTSLEEGAEAAEQEKEPEEEEEEESGDNELAYFDMKDTFVVNFPKSSGIRLLQVSVALLVKGESSVEVLQKHEPMIRNNYLMLISGQTPGDLKTVEGKEKLQALMLEEVGKVMKKMGGKNRVQDVFFTSFVMQ